MSSAAIVAMIIMGAVGLFVGYTFGKAAFDLGYLLAGALRRSNSCKCKEKDDGNGN